MSLKSSLLALSAVLTLDSKDYEKGLADSEGKAESFASKLKNGLATAGKVVGGALLAVGTASAGAATAMLKGAQNAAAYGDNIDKMSQKMGISAEAYQEWDFIMQHAGTSMETLKASMKTLSSAAISGKDAFDRLGISQEAIAQMSQEELFSATIEALQGVADETERTYLTGQLLGRGATELGALLNMSAQEVADMRQQVHDLGGVMSDEAVKASAGYADNVQDLQVAMSGFGRTLTSSFVPGISKAAKGLAGVFAGDSGAGGEFKNGVTELISTLGEALPEFMEKAGEIVKAVAEAITESLPELFASGAEILGALVTGIIEMLPSLAETAVQLIAQLAQGVSDALPELIPTIVGVMLAVVETLTNNIPMLIDAALALMTGLAQGLVNAIPVLLARLPEIITSLVNGLLGAIPQIIQAGIDLLTALVGALPEIIRQIVAVIPKIINGIIGALMDNLPLIIQAGIDLLVALIQALPEIITTIVGAIPEIIGGILNALIENLPLIIQAGVDLFVALIENLPTIIAEIVKAVPKIIEGIVSAIGSLAWKLVEAGGNLVSGLWKGISNSASWLWDKVKGWLDGLWGGIKKFFGIHSPSTLFRDQFGKNLMLGFADGINRYGDYGVDAMDDWSQRINDAVDIDPIEGGLGSTSSGRNRGGWTLNVYAPKMTPAEAFEEAQRVADDAQFLGFAPVTT